MLGKGELKVNISSPLSFDYSNKRLVVDTVDDYVRMFRLFFNKNIAKPEYSWQRDSSLLEYLKVVCPEYSEEIIKNWDIY